MKISGKVTAIVKLPTYKSPNSNQQKLLNLSAHVA